MKLLCNTGSGYYLAVGATTKNISIKTRFVVSDLDTALVHVHYWRGMSFMDMEDERDQGKEEEERLCLVFHHEQEEHFTDAVYRSHNGVSLNLNATSGCLSHN